MKFSNIFLLSHLVGLILFSSCSEPKEVLPEVENETSHYIEVTDSQFVASQFMEGTMEMRSFANELNATGMIDLPSKNKTIISTYIGGVVQKMDLVMGHPVKKGQRLFTVTNPELIVLQQEFLEIKSQIPFLEEELTRQTALAEGQVSAAKNLAKAKADLQLAQAKFSGLSSRLKLMGIQTSGFTSESLTSTLPYYAPISGYITSLNIVNGGFLPPSTTALEITNPQELHVELKILENDIHKIKLGQQVTFHIRDNPESTFKTTIHTIENQVDENRQVTLHCEMTGPETKYLMPGMFVTAAVALGQETMPAIPQDAVVTIDNKKFVLEKVSGGSGHQYASKNVEIGELKNGYYPLINRGELSEGAVILVKGAYYILQ